MPPMRYLVVTADDFGFSKERNNGILEAFNKCAVKSASILLNCTGTNEAVLIAKENDICSGLHLNLTEGRPVGQACYKTLVNDDGIFWGKKGLRAELNANRICAQEVRQEIESQIMRYRKLFGNKPLYVDGHQHIHVHPGISKIFAEVLHNEDIQVTRYPVEPRVFMRQWLKPEMKSFFSEIVKDAEHSRPILELHGIRSTDVFVGLSTMGSDMTTERLQSVILEAFMSIEEKKPVQNMHKVTCELMTHPGHPTDRRYGGFCWGTDDFGAAEERTHEVDILSSPEMMAFYKCENITVVSHSVV